MGLTELCPDKVGSTEQAISLVKNGSRVFIGTGCGEPQHLIRTMVESTLVQDVILYQMFAFTLADYIDDPTFLSRFSLKLFFISTPMRRAAFEGKIDYVPVYLSRIPHLFASRRIGLDVALVQVSPPDRFGFCSLGVAVDITMSGLKAARTVIAQVNPRMPRTRGETMVHIDEIDHFVLFEEPLVESVPPSRNPEVVQRIGYYVNQLIEDGSTLQIGFGFLPQALLPFLEEKKDLGIHTQMVSDGIMALMEKKVITNALKNEMRGRVVASMCMGSEELYRFIDNNPRFFFSPSDFVSDPVKIARNERLISISSALEVDLTGQVCSDSTGYLFYSGIVDQVDFLRGSSMSKGGFSIIVLPSTALNDRASRIVPSLAEGSGVATTRGDVDFVVTEYGIAELQGKSIYQRVMELTQIAHPKYRESLIEVAKNRHYIFKDQLPPVKDDLLFLEEYKSSLPLKNGQTVEFRPVLPSDELAYRNFYYSLNEETIYMRFFFRMNIFSHAVVQQQWASVDYRKNMSLVGLLQKGGHQEIVAVGSYADNLEGRAEVAFVVREDMQGQGMATHLLAQLEAIAKGNGFKGFVATVLKSNHPMLSVFRKRYPNLRFTKSSGFEILIEMDFKLG